MIMPKVSIVAPVYGVEKYIHEFLQSIREQTFQDLEVILVDDGSKDNCPAILDEFVKEDIRYRVIHQQNGGVAKARNTGLSYVTGDYVYIVDSDDKLDPKAVEVLYEEAVRTNSDIVYGDWVRESEKSKKYMTCFPDAFCTDDPDTIRCMQQAVFSNSTSLYTKCKQFDHIDSFGGAPWRAMLRTSIIKDNGLLFDPYVRGLGDDILFTLHVYEYVKRVAYVQHPIYYYRVVSASYSHGYKANYLESVQLIYDHMEEFLQKYNKDSEFTKYYYYRIYIYLQQGMVRYFKNAGNPKSDSERYKEFVNLVKTEPYKTALHNLPIDRIKNKKNKLRAVLLRMGLYRVYWML